MNVQLLPERLSISRVKPSDPPTCRVPMDRSCMQKVLHDQAEQLKTLILHIVLSIQQKRAL